MGYSLLVDAWQSVHILLTRSVIRSYVRLLRAHFRGSVAMLSDRVCTQYLKKYFVAVRSFRADFLRSTLAVRSAKAVRKGSGGYNRPGLAVHEALGEAPAALGARTAAA